MYVLSYKQKFINFQCGNSQSDIFYTGNYTFKVNNISIEVYQTY